MQELINIAKEIIPEADIEMENNLLRLSWKTNDDPDRPEKRYQPIIIEIHEELLDFILRINSGKFPQHVSPELRKEFSSFLRYKRSQFNPCTTENLNKSHTPEYWVFSPET